MARTILDIAEAASVWLLDFVASAAELLLCLSADVLQLVEDTVEKEGILCKRGRHSFRLRQAKNF